MADIIKSGRIELDPSRNDFPVTLHDPCKVSGRRQMRQFLPAFQGLSMDKEHPKYVCAPCSNCKGQIRDMLKYYDAWEKAGIGYGGLAELVVNAMTEVKPGFIDWERH